MVSVGLIFVPQTQHPKFYHCGGVSVAKENVTHLALVEVAEKFLHSDPKDRSRNVVGCATSAPYGSSPGVFVRVVDSSRDFNSAVVGFRSVGHKNFGCLNQSSLWEYPPSP